MNHRLFSRAALGIEIDGHFIAVVAADDQSRPLFQQNHELSQETRIFNFYMVDTHLALPPFPVYEAGAITLATAVVWLAIAVVVLRHGQLGANAQQRRQWRAGDDSVPMSIEVIPQVCVAGQIGSDPLVTGQRRSIRRHDVVPNHQHPAVPMSRPAGRLPPLALDLRQNLFTRQTPNYIAKMRIDAGAAADPMLHDKIKKTMTNIGRMAGPTSHRIHLLRDSLNASNRDSK